MKKKSEIQIININKKQQLIKGHFTPLKNTKILQNFFAYSPRQVSKDKNNISCDPSISQKEN